MWNMADVLGLAQHFIVLAYDKWTMDGNISIFSLAFHVWSYCSDRIAWYTHQPHPIRLLSSLSSAL
jgi:hypothetical protein